MPLSATPELSLQLLTFSQEASTWQTPLALGVVADEVGIDRVVVSEHILLGERLDRYGDPKAGGSAGGKQPTDSDGHWLDPLTFLAVLAGRTERVRLGTAVLLAALRPAALLAKQLATLDVLSAGRVDLGVGVGWQREEYEACGLDFDARGTMLDDCLHLCQRLWTDDVVDHDAGPMRFDRIHANPKPLQSGGIPIWVSGRATPRTSRRVAAFGDGWIPWGDDVTDPRPGIERMREALAATGRDPNKLLVQGALPMVRRDDGAIDVDASMAGVPALVAAGVTDFRAYGRWGADLAADAVVLGELVSAFGATVGR